MNPTRSYIGAALIALAGLLFWVLLMPAYDRIAGLRDAVDQRATILSDRSAVVADLASLNKQDADHASQIQRFAQIVPTTKSAPEIVSTIQAVANQNGLTLTSIALAGGTNQDNSPYNVQPIDIGLSGSYLSFRSFLSALENNIRIIDVLTIDANPMSDNTANLSFRVKANAYYLK